MSFYQWLIIAICTFLNALDGYDVLAISLSSNQVTEEFGLSATALGLVMSAALFGMAAGALIRGPVAARIGRGDRRGPGNVPEPLRPCRPAHAARAHDARRRRTVARV